MKSFTVCTLLALAIASLLQVAEAMPVKRVKKQSGRKLGKRALEFTDFEYPLDSNDISLPYFDFEDWDDGGEDDVEGEVDIFKRDSGAESDLKTRRKRQLSASEDYFDFFPPPPTAPMPDLDSDEQTPTQPSPNIPGDTAEVASLIPQLSLGKTSTLDIAKLIVQRSRSLRDALIASLKHVIQSKTGQNCISADGAITAIKIQALGNGNQILTNGLMNFMAFLPKVMTITMDPSHSGDEHKVLIETFQILEKTLSKIRKEVDPIMDENIDEDQVVVKMLNDVNLLVTEINAQAAELKVPENIIRAAAPPPSPMLAPPEF